MPKARQGNTTWMHASRPIEFLQAEQLCYKREVLSWMTSSRLSRQLQRDSLQIQTRYSCRRCGLKNSSRWQRCRGKDSKQVSAEYLFWNNWCLPKGRGIKRSNDTEDDVEQPKKCVNHTRNMHQSRTPDIEIRNSNNMSTSGNFDLIVQAWKSCVVIKMGHHIKPQTDHMDGTKVTHQAAFEDVGWEPMVLEMKAEK